ncbi:MAG TPA: transcription-repair coupling factor [Moraxellaceae bacterium]|nr:transcription-repair coupling factor [Moraxellaceae bacterium]
MPLTALPALPELPHKPGDRRHWGHLYGGALALSLAAVAERHPGVVMVITADTRAATRLEEELGFFLGERLPLLHFADWETLPYDPFSPHQDIVSARLKTLARLPALARGLLVVPVTTLAHRIAPRGYLGGRSLSLKKGQKLDIADFRRQLEAAGYTAVDTVYEHGEFAVRGSLLDLFPMGMETPLRIELFDDEVETLRTFDPETQRTVEAIPALELLPAKEFPLDKAAIRRFRDAWAEAFSGDPKRSPVYQDVSNGLAASGIEYYLPLFFEQTGTLFDYLPGNTLVLLDNGAGLQVGNFWQEIRNRYEDRRHDGSRPLLPPERLFLRDNELFEALGRFPRIEWQSGPLEERPGQANLPFAAPPALPVDIRQEQPLAALEAFRREHPATRLLFCAETAGRRESLLELLARAALKPRAVGGWEEFLAQADDAPAIAVGPLEQGLWLTEPPLAVITESQLLGQRVMQSRRRKATSQDVSSEMVIRNLSELQPGAPVVHIDHGVGRYQGLVTLEIDGQVQEFLLLEYADNARLYVPVSSLQLIARYAGHDDEHAPLHRLGTEQWTKARRKAAEQVRDTAAELLNIYARRAARPGHGFGFNEGDYALFAAGFPFEETADQAAAIIATIADLRAKRPMDRLVCGDVGFGKTEVAMRAAFVAVQDGRQVAVLVPTTLLAQQHYENFRDRFADWPVKIEVLSRFKSAKEQTAALKQLEEGKIDIIIGTHKLLGEDVRFRNLGLIIVDEEHRFGVRHKEALKNLRAEVDMLTLTATPIPRTLNMAFSGMRDLSIIATPPARRLAVKTFVRESHPAVVKEAILRELLRGGQVYYLHNEVDSIEKCAQELQALVPEARIGIAHGQMRERELEQVMQQFYHKQFNVLVCTTIVETGIDVPSANTIIMDRADKLGLAQLHQLRGRVGRSHHQAYAYLLTPHQKAMTGDAEKRLEAIAAAGELGAGFALASHDLEIRGAGELLGEEQSGNINTVGFTLYMEMLEEAVKAIKAGKTPNLDKPLAHGADVNLRISALIPDAYLPDVHNRLMLYKRISNAKSQRELDELQVEMIDRFGLLPEQTKNLFAVTSLKLEAEKLGIVKIDASAGGGRIEFGSETKVDPMRLVKLIQTQPRKFKLEGADKLRFIMEMQDPAVRLQRLRDLLQALQ